MSTAWDLSAIRSAEVSYTPATGRLLAPFVVGAAVLYNFVLCFVVTKLFGISARLVIVCEIVIIGMAFGLIWYRTRALYAILLLLAAYLFVVMVIRFDFDPKLVRDVLIPIAFFVMGSHLGSLRSADKLMTLLIILTLSAALFEWLALNTYLHYFDVMKYYVARGTETNLGDSAGGMLIKGTDTAASLYINGTRFGARTLLSLLGDHRVSGIFLEPVSAGNFGAIAFAWVLLRDCRRFWAFIAKMLAIATVLVLADARFGFYLSVFVLVVYLAAPVIRPTMLFVAPFLAMIGLVTYAAIGGHGVTDNDIIGRVLDAGHSLARFDAWQAFGLQTSDAFFSGYAGDSGYGYVLTKIGLVGLAAMWALFAYTRVADKEAWRFKNFITVYVVSLLAISASIFSIKTAALLWFLYGTLNNPNRAACA
jgi:putative polymerase